MAHLFNTAVKQCESVRDSRMCKFESLHFKPLLDGECELGSHCKAGIDRCEQGRLTVSLAICLMTFGSSSSDRLDVRVSSNGLRIKRSLSDSDDAA